MQRFIALYASFGITLEPYDNLDGGYGIYLSAKNDSSALHPHSRVLFDENQKFVDQEFYE